MAGAGARRAGVSSGALGVGTSRRASTRSHVGSLRVPRQATVRALRHPDLAGCSRVHRRRGGRRRGRHRLPGGRQSPGPRRRARQGGRRQARRRPRRVPHPRLQHPRYGHQGPPASGWSGSSKPATSPASTTRRSPSTGRRSSTSGCSPRRAASRSKRSRRRTPTRSPASRSTPSTGSPPPSARNGSSAAGLDPDARAGTLDILQKLWRCYEDADADLVEINPLILTTDGRGAGPRRQGDPRRQLGDPPPRVRASTRRPSLGTPGSRKRSARASSTSASRAPSASSPTGPGWP